MSTIFKIVALISGTAKGVEMSNQMLRLLYRTINGGKNLT
jgi:hypothetical protein